MPAPLTPLACLLVCLSDGTGQADTDLFIMVRAGFKDQCTNTVAWAFSCFFDTATNRPILGFVNVCPLFFDATQFAPPLDTQVTTIVHEMTHALVCARVSVWVGVLLCAFHDFHCMR